jgi:hypothetical protein
MKKILLTIITWTLTTTLTVGQNLPKKYDFSIIIASCFESADIVEIKLNDTDICRMTDLKSDFATGLTDLRVYQDDEGLWIINRHEKIKKDKLTIGKRLKLDVTVNGEINSKELNLKKGRIIFVDNCYMRAGTDKILKTNSINQHKKQVIIE